MAKKIHDLVIIGAGPSALTAALYSAREDMDTLLFEKSAVGGNAAITDMIDNYSGFPEGIAGYELADKMQKQAERFGAVIQFGEVTSLKKTGKKLSVVVDNKDIQAKSILIATGSSYMKIGVPGEAEFYGRGVHYCATCDGAFYSKKNVIVIGGGNSAVQEAMFLTRFASHVDIVALFDISASEILKDQLKKYVADNKISIHENTKTNKILSENKKVTGISATKNGKDIAIKADGVFVFIGLKPNTQFLKDSEINLDKCGFVKTDDKLMANIPGVFASGDVRSGATMQVASAVGEGATAAINIREYLGE